MESLAQVRDALPSFGFNDYVRHLKAVESLTTTATPLRVAVLRSYTAEQIEPVLTVQMLVNGYRPTFWFGGYNQYVQEILDPASGLYRFGPGLVLLLTRIEELQPDFVEQYSTRPAESWGELLEAKARELGSLAGRAAAQLSAQVIVQSASLTRPYFGVYDVQQHDGQQQAGQRFNRALAVSAAENPGVLVWDYDGFVRARGFDQLSDPKSWYVARSPYKQSAYPAIAEDLMRSIRSALGGIKKCVVLDLDNTLWGGIVGEDGIDGIQLGATYPGNCYRDFQRELLKLHDRGIVLAINSKNNEADALRVIDAHPDMVLRRQHFAAMRINWQDKATNLREIARELNIGIDSLIFIDDNPAECALVRQECPECDVVLAPDKPYLLPAVVSRLPGIETIRLTAEDRKKASLYRARAAQHEAEAQFSNVEDFLRSLEMEVEIAPATGYSIPRIAQLTQKTNQWNMTTRRYTEAQITVMADGRSHAVFSIAARDRFGDHGVIGVCILEFAGSDCVIDTFLLSCRVIGRGIEQMMLAHAATLARSRGLARLVGVFIPTAKNAPADGFYERTGLVKADDSNYLAALDAFDCPPPAHIKVMSRSPVDESIV